jgi:NAD(P) transhydrogenase subunit beta
VIPNWVPQAGYFAASILFIAGLRAMSSPVTARAGIRRAGYAMVVATVVTLFTPHLQNLPLILAALAVGTVAAWISGQRVAMTDMPQMVALYNGMGGGAAAAIAAIEFLKNGLTPGATSALASLGGLIGAVSFSGSLVAFAKLQGLLKRTFALPGQNFINALLALVTIGLGVAAALGQLPTAGIVAFFALALVLGAVVTLPIGGADMPVVISLFNAFTGLAVGFEGYVLKNPALIIAGIVVGAAGTLLTQLMAKAMNRPITNILFQPITGAAAGGTAITGTMKEIGALDAASVIRFAEKVIIIPGYGMAVAHAQHKVWEMAQLLGAAGVEVKFAIHPVAGRMPGHMNVLLAEAGVPYDCIFDLEEINAEFPQADVALVIGANDVVNPVARTDKTSPIYGMPILNADQARNVIVVKRGQGTGYSGIDNALFTLDQTRMLYGSAQQVAADLVTQIKALG